MTEQRPRRVGWVVVALGAAALVIPAVYLLRDSFGTEPTDEAWLYIAVFVGPLLAGGTGLAIGLLIVLVATLRLVDVPVSRAAKATGVGFLLAPVIFIVTLIGAASLFESLNITGSWTLPWLALALPIAVAIVTIAMYLVPTPTPRAGVPG